MKNQIDIRTDSRIIDIIVRSDHAQVQWLTLYLIFYTDTL